MILARRPASRAYVRDRGLPGRVLTRLGGERRRTMSNIVNCVVVAEERAAAAAKATAGGAGGDGVGEGAPGASLPPSPPPAASPETAPSVAALPPACRGTGADRDGRPASRAPSPVVPMRSASASSLGSLAPALGRLRIEGSASPLPPMVSGSSSLAESALPVVGRRPSPGRASERGHAPCDPAAADADRRCGRACSAGRGATARPRPRSVPPCLRACAQRPLWLVQGQRVRTAAGEFVTAVSVPAPDAPRVYTASFVDGRVASCDSASLRLLPQSLLFCPIPGRRAGDARLCDGWLTRATLKITLMRCIATARRRASCLRRGCAITPVSYARSAICPAPPRGSVVLAVGQPAGRRLRGLQPP